MHPRFLFGAIGAAVLLCALAISLAAPDASAQMTAAVRGELPAIDAKVQAAVIDSVTKALNETYVFADKAAQMDAALHANFTAGAYATVTDPVEFMERLQADIAKVHLDLHMRLMALPPAGAAPQQAAPPPAAGVPPQDMARRANYWFKKVEILPGNVGYLKMNQFERTSLAAPTAAGAMAFLANSDAVIIDLRDNGGGSPSMIRFLAGYFFAQKTHLISWYNRRLDKTTQSWSEDWVPGKTMYDTPVYILTSSFTGSAAEEFAYDFKCEKRATIVGEKTGGAAHTVEFHTFDVGVFVAGLRLPAGRAISPVTGANWEAVGVEPDIAVPADEALATAHLEALKKIEGKADEAGKRAVAWAREGIEASLHPYALPAKALKEYAGEYGLRQIRLDGSRLVQTRDGGVARALVPMRKDLFGVDGMDGQRIRFTRDTSGRVDGLVALYDVGREEPNPRTK